MSSSLRPERPGDGCGDGCSTDTERRSRHEGGLLGAVGQVDHRLPGLRDDEQLVAHRCCVHDQVAVHRIRRPRSAAGVRPGRGRQRRGECASRATVADHTRAPGIDAVEDRTVGVATDDAAFAEDEGVDGGTVYLVAGLDDRLLVRDGHVGAGKAERAQPAHRFDDVEHVERGVVPVEPTGGERRVLHAWRQRRRDRVSEESDLLGQQP